MRAVRLAVVLLAAACGVSSGDDKPNVWAGERGAPAAIYFHGVGSNGDLAGVGALERLRDAGWTVASTRAGGPAWGNDDSVEDYRRLIRDVQREQQPSRLVLIGESMGALAALRLADEPGVTAWVGVNPVTDVRALVREEPKWTESVDAAGGFVATPKQVRVPATILVTPADAEVPAAASRLAGARTVPCTGEHISADCWDKAIEAVLAARSS